MPLVQLRKYAPIKTALASPHLYLWQLKTHTSLINLLGAKGFCFPLPLIQSTGNKFSHNHWDGRAKRREATTVIHSTVWHVLPPQLLPTLRVLPVCMLTDRGFQGTEKAARGSDRKGCISMAQMQCLCHSLEVNEKERTEESSCKALKFPMVFHFFCNCEVM